MLWPEKVPMRYLDHTKHDSSLQSYQNVTLADRGMMHALGLKLVQSPAQKQYA